MSAASTLSPSFARGADPNGDAAPGDRWEWISAAGSHPRPLHCVAIAWQYTPEHEEIAKLLTKMCIVLGARGFSRFVYLLYESW